MPSDQRVFYRRIHSTQFTKDKNTGLWRFSSAAFRDPSLSCDDSQILKQHGLDYNFCLKGFLEFSLAAMPAQLVLDMGQRIVPDPLPNNPAHTLIMGKKSQSIATRLCAISTTVVFNPPKD